ncbi:MAG: sulfotransferase [Sandaracinaceae bacterium]|nr:sulfotransferase [Sandaracinaceae bacterium]
MIDESRPIFITGLMRTGSTLFLSLLDNHPELLVYPDEPSFERLYDRQYESPAHLRDDFLFGTPNPLHLYEAIRAEHLDPIGFSARGWEPVPRSLRVASEILDRAIQGLKLRGALTDEAAFDFRAYHRVLGRELDALDEISPRGAILAAARAAAAAIPKRTNPRFFVYKQPLPHFREQSVVRFFRDFPDGKLIVLLRDPRAFLASMLDYTDEERIGLGALLRRELYFLRRLAVLEDDFLGFAGLEARYGAERVLILRYESLILELEETMARVADFLGIAFDEAMLQPSKLGHPVRVPTAAQGAEGGGTRIYDASLERYRDRLGRTRLRLIDAALSRYEGKKAPLWLPLLRSSLGLLHRLRPLDQAPSAMIRTGSSPCSAPETR